MTPEIQNLPLLGSYHNLLNPTKIDGSQFPVTDLTSPLNLNLIGKNSNNPLDAFNPNLYSSMPLSFPNSNGLPNFGASSLISNTTNPLAAMSATNLHGPLPTLPSLSNNNVAPPSGNPANMVSAGINQLGGYYSNGRPLNEELRKKIISMSRKNIRPCEISRRLKVSHGCVSKILSRFHKTGSIKPGIIGGSRPRVAKDFIIQKICSLKRENPQLFAWEIRKKLEDQKVCGDAQAPSISSINRILRQNYKKIDENLKNQAALHNLQAQALLQNQANAAVAAASAASASVSNPNQINLPTFGDYNTQKLICAAAQVSGQLHVLPQVNESNLLDLPNTASIDQNPLLKIPEVQIFRCKSPELTDFEKDLLVIERLEQ